MNCHRRRRGCKKDAIDVIDVEEEEEEPPQQQRQKEGNREQGNDEQQQEPWWSKGKTAPLLNDFESSKRSFYLAQAGVTSNLDRGLHSFQGQGRVVDAAQPSPSHVKRALTLAGNANSSNSSNIPDSSTQSITVTPRKKTWNATWAEDGERASSKKKQATTPTSTNEKTRSTPLQSKRGSLGGRVTTPSSTKAGRLQQQKKQK
jgi:hypothetical protein